MQCFNNLSKWYKHIKTQIEQNKYKKAEEKTFIFSTYTFVNPVTMMIIFINTFVTNPAVFRIFCLFNNTIRAVFIYFQIIFYKSLNYMHILQSKSYWIHFEFLQDQKKSSKYSPISLSRTKKNTQFLYYLSLNLTIKK